MMPGLPWEAGRFRSSWYKFLAIGSVLALAGTLAERTMSAGARRRSLEKTQMSSGSGAFVKVDDVKFDRYVTGVPRQYEAFVYFTASAPEYKCQSCSMVHDEFVAAAESYAAARKKQPEVLKGADIFFFVADFSRNKGSFSQLGLQTVPRIMHFPAALTEGEGGRYVVDPSQHMQMMGKVQAEDIARFIKEKTGATIPIVRPEPPVAIILCVLLVLGLLALKPILANLGVLLRVIRNKHIWLSVSLMVYTFGISGGVYDIIRNPAPFHVKPDGTIMWFHPQANVQLVAEGFIVGIMTLLCGISGIMLVQVAPKLGSTRARQVAVGMFGTGFIYLFFNVLKLYKSKNPWYRPVF